MNELHMNLDETEKIKEVFREVDRDGDGEISFMEFFTKLPTIMARVNPLYLKLTDYFRLNRIENGRKNSIVRLTPLRCPSPASL